MDAESQRCRRGKKRQAQASPDLHVTNGFLRTTFLPKLQASEMISALTETDKMERDFFSSLSLLYKHYSIGTMPTESFAYPYNIATAIWDTEEKLKAHVRNFEKLRLVQDENRTFITTEERYNTGAMLYYIPVMPLYRMLRNKKRKHTAHLMLSVFAYLYHVADIPYYRQEGSYLYYRYEMLKEWILEDEYTEEMPHYMSEFQQAEQIGDMIEQKIFNRLNLKFFRKRLNAYRVSSKGNADQRWLEIAEKAYRLYKDYPKAKYFRNATPNGEANEDDRDWIVRMEVYVSFCADSFGWLSDNLEEFVNNDLQEYGQVEEPAIIKRFDGSAITENNLEFEYRLFALLNELAYALNNYND